MVGGIAGFNAAALSRGCMIPSSVTWVMATIFLMVGSPVSPIVGVAVVVLLVDFGFHEFREFAKRLLPA